MKNLILIFSIVLSFAIFASLSDDNTLRTQIRYNAETKGVSLTGVWTRVQSDRMMVIFGGTLSSTQELHTLFCSITNFNNFVRQVQQTLTTPQGNPYPQFFSVGYDPYKKKKK